MKYYVGQIETIENENKMPRTTQMPISIMLSPVIIIGDIIYYYSLKQNRVAVVSLSREKIEFVNIMFNEDGEPSHGTFVDENSAWDRFLQLIKELKKDAKENNVSISVGGLVAELNSKKKKSDLIGHERQGSDFPVEERPDYTR